MKCFYTDRFVLPLPPTHRFPMEKYQRLRERLLADGVLRPEDLCEPPAASWDELRLVHDDEYLRAVAEGRLAPDLQRRIGFPWSPAMVERSRRSVGGTIAAARAALGDGIAANLAGGTHHAFRDRGEGYCVFNDVAVAARVLLQAGACARIAVVDCDVHQGNGTAAIFRGDPAVFTFSLHGEKNYPFKKETSDLDITLPDGARTTSTSPPLKRACARSWLVTIRSSSSTSPALTPTRAIASPAGRHGERARGARSSGVLGMPRRRPPGGRLDGRRLRPRR